MWAGEFIIGYGAGSIPGPLPGASGNVWGPIYFYAPVAFRFQTYGVDPGGEAAAYARALLAVPAVKEWEAGGRGDTVLPDHDLDRMYPEDEAA